MSGNPLFLGINLLPHFGGPYKTVGEFHKALGGRIVSPLDRSAIIADHVNPAAEHVPVRTHHYYGRKTLDALDHYASAASLISCHSIFRFHTQAAKRLSQRHKIPYWSVPHGGMDPWVFSYGRIQKETWFRIFGKAFFEGARFVILATEREREKMRQRYDGDNMRVVHWPISPVNVDRQSEAHKTLRQRLHIEPDARVLIYFGRYHSMKRPVETLQLFHQANLSKRTYLVMAGVNGDILVDDLKRECARLGTNNTILLGPVFNEQRDELLLGADGYISLSHRENFNHTAAESMAANTAVILSHGNDLAHSFPNSARFGWKLSQEATSEEIVETLRVFDSISDETLLKMGSDARDWATRTLSFRSFREKLEALLIESIG